jgi:ribosome-binding protein aMBF1 (putative translation factor)
MKTKAKIIPEQALAELALLPHDQPIRPKKAQKNLPRAVTEPGQIDAMLEDIIFAETLKELIATARQQSGLTLREAAANAGMKHPQFVQIEQSSGRVELRTLARIAEALDFELHVSLVPKQGGPSIETNLTPA